MEFQLALSRTEVSSSPSGFGRLFVVDLEIAFAFSSAYRPQTNGQAERTNQTLEQYLRCFSSSQDDWVFLLPIAEFAYNNSLHSAIKQTPFFANFGFHPSFLPSTLPECYSCSIRNNGLLPYKQQTLAGKTQEYNKKMFDRKKRGEQSLEVFLGKVEN